LYRHSSLSHCSPSTQAAGTHRHWQSASPLGPGSPFGTAVRRPPPPGLRPLSGGCGVPPVDRARTPPPLPSGRPPTPGIGLCAPNTPHNSISIHRFFLRLFMDWIRLCVFKDFFGLYVAAFQKCFFSSFAKKTQLYTPTELIPHRPIGQSNPGDGAPVQRTAPQVFSLTGEVPRVHSPPEPILSVVGGVGSGDSAVVCAHVPPPASAP